MTTDASGNWSFTELPYDLAFNRPGALIALDVVNKVVIPRTVNVHGSVKAHVGNCDTAPVGAAVLTVYTATLAAPTTWTSKGTINFANGATTATFSIADFALAANDLLKVEVTTPNGIAGVYITLTGFIA